MSSKYVSCLYYKLGNFVFQVSEQDCYTKVCVIITSNCTHEVKVRIRYTFSNVVRLHTFFLAYFYYLYYLHFFFNLLLTY